MHDIPHVARRELISFDRWNLGIFNVTNEVILLWVSAVITFVFLALACRRKGMVARGTMQNLFEGIIEFLERDAIRGIIGKAGKAWAPFLVALFFFILFGNLLGLVPAPYSVKSATANLNVTGALAAMVFIVTIVAQIRCRGLRAFLGRFKPSGVPWWLSFLVVPIEIVVWFMRPVSLALRLFANMIAGHAVIMLLIVLGVSGHWLTRPLPILGAAVMSAFEVFVSFVQAFIFTVLTALYIGEAVSEEVH